MSRSYIQRSDFKKRNIMYKNESHSMLLNCLYKEHLIYSDANLIDALHSNIFQFSHYLNLKRSINSMYQSKVRNRCICSGSSRAVFGKYKLSRFFFKMFARNGNLNGITKSS